MRQSILWVNSEKELSGGGVCVGENKGQEETMWSSKYKPGKEQSHKSVSAKSKLRIL